MGCLNHRLPVFVKPKFAGDPNGATPGSELATHEVSGPRRRRVGDRGAPGPAADRPSQAELRHQTLNGATRHLDALTIERQPHFACPIHPEVRRVDPLDLGFEHLVAGSAAAGLALDLVVVRRWGDLYAEFNQPGADRLDTPPQTIRAFPIALMISDEPTN